MVWILFYYNSLPDLPSACPFFSSDLMHRDFLMCNPSNTGHYKYPKFETLSYDDGCHYREVHSFLNRLDPNKYVIFYTRHTNSKGHRKNKVIGYFKVGKLTKQPFGFIASDVVLLPKYKAIPITYASRGVPTSWGKSTVKHELNIILSRLMSLKKFDLSGKYQKETESVMKMLRCKTSRTEMLKTCGSCNDRLSCYWGKKPFATQENILKELYESKKSC